MRVQRRLALVLAVAAGLASAQKPREIKPGFNLFSRQQDIQLGREAAREIERQVTVVASQPQLTNYIADLGNRLAKVSQAPDYPYTFKVIAEKGINAFALPGGPIYVHAETIASADNEAQLAGVVAHEISHVALRHSTHQVTKAYGLQIGLALAGSLIGSGSLLAELTQLGLGFGANSLMLKYSRDAERDADIVGARMMASTGLDPVEMARFFEKLEGQGGRGRGIQFLSDHPNPGNRVKYVEEEVRIMPRRSYSKGSSEFAQFRAVASGIPASGRRGREQAAAPAPVVSRGPWREFRGRGFRLNHPENWQAHGSDSGLTVTMVPPQGVVRDSQGRTEIKVGAIAGFFSPNDSDLSRATDELIQDVRTRDPALRVARGQRRQSSLGGSRGETLILVKPGEIDTVITAGRPEGLFYLILVSPEADYNTLRPTLQQIQSSVRFQ